MCDTVWVILCRVKTHQRHWSQRPIPAGYLHAQRPAVQTARTSSSSTPRSPAAIPAFLTGYAGHRRHASNTQRRRQHSLSQQRRRQDGSGARLSWGLRPAGGLPVPRAASVLHHAARHRGCVWVWRRGGWPAGAHDGSACCGAWSAVHKHLLGTPALNAQERAEDAAAL